MSKIFQISSEGKKIEKNGSNEVKSQKQCVISCRKEFQSRRIF